MAQLTDSLIAEFKRHHTDGKHAPMTIYEEMALVYAWEELQKVRASLPVGQEAVGEVSVYRCDLEEVAESIHNNMDGDAISRIEMMLSAPAKSDSNPVKMRLTSGDDGLFAHFQIGDGYQCGINLDHIELCKRFCDEYRASIGAAPSHAESAEEKGKWTFEQRDDLAGIFDSTGKRIATSYASVAEAVVSAHNASLATHPVNAGLEVEPYMWANKGDHRWVHIGATPPDDECWIPLFTLSAVEQYKADAEKAYKDTTPQLHVGDSSFENWYQAHPKACGGDKQLARDAYAAGMGDPLVACATNGTGSVPDHAGNVVRALRDIAWSDEAHSSPLYEQAANLIAMNHHNFISHMALADRLTYAETTMLSLSIELGKARTKIDDLNAQLQSSVAQSEALAEALSVAKVSMLLSSAFINIDSEVEAVEKALFNYQATKEVKNG